MTKDYAEDKAFFCIAFHLQPSEYDNLTLVEREAFIRMGKKADIIK